ncbi:hypothetical protein [Rubritalea profundi]|uniref:Uncharacterized protein n=1 Tax=Rubritalea profundi TaxID=1658618 RepID=A0A2S7TZC5_9BACT|nr:hypothetical protein [Rubritalea profundi]PQJ27422.1 hypothetical protein BSZ32_02195 [Rubritalea profundi]
MPKKPDNKLLEVFENFPKRSTYRQTLRWIIGGSLSTNQSSLTAKMVYSQARAAHVIIKMEDNSSEFELNPDFYKEGKPQYSRSYKSTLSTTDERRSELHAKFSSMQPGSFVEVLSFISGAEIVDGKIPLADYRSASLLWQRADRNKVIIQDIDNQWRYNGRMFT